jgi:hypothetical protein
MGGGSRDSIHTISEFLSIPTQIGALIANVFFPNHCAVSSTVGFLSSSTRTHSPREPSSSDDASAVKTPEFSFPFFLKEVKTSDETQETLQGRSQQHRGHSRARLLRTLSNPHTGGRRHTCTHQTRLGNQYTKIRKIQCPANTERASKERVTCENGKCLAQFLREHAT